MIEFAITTLSRINIYDISLRVALLTNTQAPDDITLVKNQLLNVLLENSDLTKTKFKKNSDTVNLSLFFLFIFFCFFNVLYLPKLFKCCL